MVKRGADRPSPGYHPVNRVWPSQRGPQIPKLGELGRLVNIARISSMGPMFLKISNRGSSRLCFSRNTGGRIKFWEILLVILSNLGDYTE